MIERESRSRRHLDRLRSPLRVVIGGCAFEALDWSLGGFALADTGQGWTRGVRFNASLDFPVNGGHWGFDAEVEAANLSPGRVGFRFRGLKPGHIDGLQRMRLACIGGQVMTLDALLAPPERPAVNADAGDRVVPGPRRRLVGLALMLALGPVVFGTGLVMLHDRLFTLRASHAAITVPVMRVRMPTDGVVHRLALMPGDPAPRDTILFDLADDGLLAEIDLAEAGLLKQTAALEAMRRRHAELTAFFADYVDLAAAAVRRAQAAEAQAKQALVLAERDVARMSDLHATGHVAQARMDDALGKVAAAQKARLAARGDLDQANANLRMARDGRYYTGSRVEGGEPARLAEDILRAEREHGLESLRIAALIERRASLAVRSPCDCSVVGTLGQAGEWLRAASEVYVLRPAEASPTVTVKLPHQRAHLLRIGDEAVLRLPQDEAVRLGRIAAVSYAPGGGSQFGLPARIDEDPAFATVVVALPEDILAPAPGTPATVAFPLSWQAAISDWLGMAPR